MVETRVTYSSVLGRYVSTTSTGPGTIPISQSGLNYTPAPAPTLNYTPYTPPRSGGGGGGGSGGGASTPAPAQPTPKEEEAKASLISEHPAPNTSTAKGPVYTPPPSVIQRAETPGEILGNVYKGYEDLVIGVQDSLTPKQVTVKQQSLGGMVVKEEIEIEQIGDVRYALGGGRTSVTTSPFARVAPPEAQFLFTNPVKEAVAPPLARGVVGVFGLPILGKQLIYGETTPEQVGSELLVSVQERPVETGLEFLGASLVPLKAPKVVKRGASAVDETLLFGAGRRTGEALGELGSKVKGGLQTGAQELIPEPILGRLPPRAQRAIFEDLPTGVRKDYVPKYERSRPGGGTQEVPGYLRERRTEPIKELDLTSVSRELSREEVLKRADTAGTLEPPKLARTQETVPVRETLYPKELRRLQRGKGDTEFRRFEIEKGGVRRSSLITETYDVDIVKKPSRKVRPKQPKEAIELRGTKEITEEFIGTETGIGKRITERERLYPFEPPKPVPPRKIKVGKPADIDKTPLSRTFEPEYIELPSFFGEGRAPQAEPTPGAGGLILAPSDELKPTVSSRPVVVGYEFPRMPRGPVQRGPAVTPKPFNPFATSGTEFPSLFPQFPRGTDGYGRLPGPFGDVKVPEELRRPSDRAKDKPDTIDLPKGGTATGLGLDVGGRVSDQLRPSEKGTLRDNLRDELGISQAPRQTLRITQRQPQAFRELQKLQERLQLKQELRAETLGDFGRPLAREFGFPQLGGSKQKRRETVENELRPSSKQPVGYAPSLTAEELNITGNVNFKKELTGLEIRPVPRRKRKGLNIWNI